eukprot:scaffold91_cov254-Pinguiococcus_pyrenoidosus.AAC.37
MVGGLYENTSTYDVACPCTMMLRVRDEAVRHELQVANVVFAHEDVEAAVSPGGRQDAGVLLAAEVHARQRDGSRDGAAGVQLRQHGIGQLGRVERYERAVFDGERRLSRYREVQAVLAALELRHLEDDGGMRVARDVHRDGVCGAGTGADAGADAQLDTGVDAEVAAAQRHFPATGGGPATKGRLRHRLDVGRLEVEAGVALRDEGALGAVALLRGAQTGGLDLDAVGQALPFGHRAHDAHEGPPAVEELPINVVF